MFNKSVNAVKGLVSACQRIDPKLGKRRPAAKSKKPQKRRPARKVARKA